MASPPYSSATSPPPASSLALPRQRPTLALPTNVKARKPSIASATSSAHPLRQTSFPPPDSLEAQHRFAEDRTLAHDDNDIRSAISGPVAADDGVSRKRKRPGEKRARGRPSTKPAGGRGARGSVNGDDTRSQRRSAPGAPSVLTADDADAEPEDDSDPDLAGPSGPGRVPLYEGGQMTKEEAAEEHHRKHAFYETVSDDHKARYDSWSRAKLRTADVRRLVNQTLSQSVPANVVLVVSAYAKMFAGMLIEEAREVQGEWMAVEEKRADGGENRALKRLKRTQQVEPDAEVGGKNGEGAKVEAKVEAYDAVKPEPTSPAPGVTLAEEVPPLYPGGAGGLSGELEECDRGPLLPDHLREALRRYKKRRAGGSDESLKAARTGLLWQQADELEGEVAEYGPERNGEMGGGIREALTELIQHARFFSFDDDGKIEEASNAEEKKEESAGTLGYGGE
ncbi:hypothetical protein B0A55_07587 [Friedmanniomyces simplex]|uniref:TAFII28-like protein domain-containing protein n=1 Tax=Friedmanniomyces simplex TaxID=329884 RepID=A0A4U0X9T4_9PEZI|nr:hypothetical protein B0A55_07587 [Friedmanniomyces simplex]